MEGVVSMIPNREFKLSELSKVNSSAGEIDGNINAHPQLSSFEYELKRGFNNLKVFITSDSTGNSSEEWTYFLTEWIAQEYVDYTTYWYEWDITTNNYKTPISFGNGGKRVDVFSFGIGGSRPDYVYNHYSNAVIDIVDTSVYSGTSAKVDVIICNHGHNLYDTETIPNIECRYADVIETILETFDGAGVVMFHQNPWRIDDTSRLNSRTAVLNYATRRGFAIADANKLFYGLNKDITLYAADDVIHPSSGIGTESSPTGQRLMLQSITSLIKGANTLSPSSSHSLYSDIKPNIMKNNTFLSWSDTSLAPSFMTAVGLTNTKDTVTYEDRIKAFSWKITTTGIGSYISLATVLSNASLAKGKWVTFGIRYKHSTGTPISGMVCSFINDTNSLAYGISTNPDKWFWKTWSRFVKDHEDLKITLYLDGSSSNGYGINIDRIFLTLGKNPHNVL